MPLRYGFKCCRNRTDQLADAGIFTTCSAGIHTQEKRADVMALLDAQL